jgi:GNAT superfamily N-acetyltransferase
MHASKFSIKPLSKHELYIPTVVNALKDEFKHRQGMELKDEDSLETYLRISTYVMVERTFTHDEIIGFFSLSRIDGLTTSGIIGQLTSLVVSYMFGRMLVYDVCILPTYRGKGMGKCMVGLIEHHCWNNYPLVRYLELHTTEPNLNHFYNKCGFQLSRMHKDICVFRKFI